jgi:PKD repeat protein
VIRILPRALPLILTLFLVSCPTTAIINQSPVLATLNADKSSGAAPLAVAFSWAGATDPDGDPVSCTLDTNNDGTPEFANFDCSSITNQNFTYQNSGNFIAKLTVSDNKGGTVSQTKTINVTAVVVPGYNIELRFAAGFPIRFKPAFQAAATRWQTIITADVPDSTQTFLAADCGVAGQTDVVGVDDLVIWVDTIAYNAANPNLLGQAGPCFSRQPSRLTLVGDMAFVDTQLDKLLTANQLTDTVMHEMGHILGIGTHWNNNPSIAIGLSSTAGTCGTNPQFVGTNALREYHALGGAGNITIENTGGVGTCDGHWKETIFGTELMTGYLNGGVANPLSKITLGSMQDLGYSIDLTKADSYQIVSTIQPQVRVSNPMIVTRPVDHLVP